VQSLFDLRATVGLTDRWSLTAGLPFLAGDWSLPLPSTTGAPRHHQESAGFGDLVLLPKAWLLDPAAATAGNLRVGLGLKIPTGNEGVKDAFPDGSGFARRPRPVDVSIQPGDGGWGAILDVEGFRRAGAFRLFASGSYLCNPREANGTASTPANLAGGAGVPSDLRRNSVPDQFLLMAGAGRPLGAGFGTSLALRWEGVLPRDLVGGSDGFRRPGHVLSVEPGLSWTTGGTTLALSVPVALRRRTVDDAAGRPTDATFADWSLLASITIRF
jgi:hypothetical protein